MYYNKAHTLQFMQSAAQLMQNMISDFETTLTLTFKAIRFRCSTVC